MNINLSYNFKMEKFSKEFLLENDNVRKLQLGEMVFLEGKKTKNGRCLFVISKIVSIFAL